MIKVAASRVSLDVVAAVHFCNQGRSLSRREERLLYFPKLISPRLRTLNPIRLALNTAGEFILSIGLRNRTSLSSLLFSFIYFFLFFFSFLLLFGRIEKLAPSFSFFAEISFLSVDSVISSRLSIEFSYCSVVRVAEQSLRGRTT